MLIPTSSRSLSTDSPQDFINFVVSSGGEDKANPWSAKTSIRYQHKMILHAFLKLRYPSPADESLIAASVVRVLAERKARCFLERNQSVVWTNKLPCVVVRVITVSSLQSPKAKSLARRSSPNQRCRQQRSLRLPSSWSRNCLLLFLKLPRLRRPP